MNPNIKKWIDKNLIDTETIKAVNGNTLIFIPCNFTNQITGTNYTKLNQDNKINDYLKRHYKGKYRTEYRACYTSLKVELLNAE